MARVQESEGDGVQNLGAMQIVVRIKLAQSFKWTAPWLPLAPCL